ncbi:MAG: hypothetical protein MJ182_07245 [Treponema sp.]|nr:hypothetical protein [Treponema sp.]
MDSSVTVTHINLGIVVHQQRKQNIQRSWIERLNENAQSNYSVRSIE